MTILDRYLLRQFLLIYFICFSSLYGLFTIFDLFTNLDDFTSQAKGSELLSSLGSYYLYRLPYFFDQTSGILMLTSAMFTIAWLQRHNELMVMLTAGLPVRRVVRPLVISAILVSLGAAASREALMPRLREPLSRTPKDLLGAVAQELKSKYDHATSVLIGGKKTIARERKIEKPSFSMPRGPLDAYGRQINAEWAQYHPAQPGRPGGYWLHGVQQPTGLKSKPSLSLQDKPIVITPQDAPWLGDEDCFVASDLTFEQLLGGPEWQQFASTWELISALNNPSLDYGALVRTTVHIRLVNVPLDLTLFFLGLPLMFAAMRTSPFLAIGQCLVIVVVYVVAILGFKHLGATSLISSSLAAWLPLMIFTPIAAWLSDPLCD